MATYSFSHNFGVPTPTSEPGETPTTRECGVRPTLSPPPSQTQIIRSRRRLCRILVLYTVDPCEDSTKLGGGNDTGPKAHVTFRRAWFPRGRIPFPSFSALEPPAGWLRLRFLASGGALGCPSRRSQARPESIDGPFGCFSPFLSLWIRKRLRRCLIRQTPNLLRKLRHPDRSPQCRPAASSKVFK